MNHPYEPYVWNTLDTISVNENPFGSESSGPEETTGLSSGLSFSIALKTGCLKWRESAIDFGDRIRGTTQAKKILLHV